MNNGNISVAIIDDGISEKFFNDALSLRCSIEISEEGKIRNRINYNKYSNSHGTICAGIINKYSPKTILTSIKIINQTNKSTSKQLIRGIEWCLYNKIDVLNLSLGSIDFRDYYDIKKVVNESKRYGLIIVAACHNSNVITYPASLTNVIGVKCDRSDKIPQEKYYFNCYSLEGIKITASSKNLLKDYKGNSFTTPICNSYATPLITAAVCNILHKNHNMTFYEILNNLKSRSINYNTKEVILNKNIDWVTNGAIFNICKKAYEDYGISYDFHDVWTQNIQCYNILDGFKAIDDILNCNIDKIHLFDTIFIVINDKFNHVCNKDVKININNAVKRIMELYNKNVVYIDDNNSFSFWVDNPKGLSIWCNTLYKNLKQGYENKKCYLQIPVIEVYGEESKEFYLLLKELNSYFKTNGYSSLVVTNKERGILYGFEFYPFELRDYEINNISGYERFNYVLESMECIYKLDIILLGKRMIDIEIDESNKKERADIKVIISEDISNINKACKENNINKIIISNKYLENMENRKDIKIFKSKDIFNDKKQSIKKIYDYISSLFD